jgi:DNA helicase HerA-like ATPase
MTGAGKSWTARRIIEQIASKNYPIVIFDPHGDYSRLHEAPILKGKVRRYYAQFPVFDEDSETVAQIVSTLAYPLTDTMRGLFAQVFNAAKDFYNDDSTSIDERSSWLAQHLSNPNIGEFGIAADMWLIAHVAAAGEVAMRTDNQVAVQRLAGSGWTGLPTYSKRDIGTLEGIKKRLYRAASVLQRMERTNKKLAVSADPLPTDRRDLVQYGQISVVSLAGYTSDFQATIYQLVADSIFSSRVNGDLRCPVLLVLEEAHNFAPAKAQTPAEHSAVNTTKQIAQEGRKFGVGLILISQRPSRLDETTLSQCNSYIIMRLVNPADQSYVRRVIETLAEDEADMLPDLDVGEALLSGQFINFPVLVRIKKPESQGEREEVDAFEQLEQEQSLSKSNR